MFNINVIRFYYNTDQFMTGWFNWTREMIAAVENYPDFVTMVFFEDLKLVSTT